MGRVKLQFPDYNPLFIATIPIRIGDINYGNHVGNDAILSIIHEARMQMLQSFGCSEMNAGGTGMIMADVMIAYKGESFYGDVLTIKVFAEEITTSTFNLLYHITAPRDGKTTDIAHGKTGMVCFDYATRKISSLTDAFSKILKTGQ